MRFLILFRRLMFIFGKIFNIFFFKFIKFLIEEIREFLEIV